MDHLHELSPWTIIMDHHHGPSSWTIFMDYLHGPSMDACTSMETMCIYLGGRMCGAQAHEKASLPICFERWPLPRPAAPPDNTSARQACRQ